MSTIAQKIQTFILRIHNKNNLTDVQFSFEETNIHQKNTFEKRARTIWTGDAFKNT